VIDDSHINIDIIFSILSEQYDLLVALDGYNGLEIANEEEHIDLILLDIMMPEIDGFEVCKKLKENEKTRDIPVIFSTAKTDEESLEYAYEVGGVDYITKPFRVKEMLARINTHLSLSEQKHKLESLILDINSSINYATRIQKSLLPSHSILNFNLKNNFVIWEPIDRIGGDLYIYEECKDYILFGVIDCTGHGIPGAIMTMLVSTLIKKLKIETTYESPAMVIARLNEDIKEYLKQNSIDGISDDGLDIGLCSIKKDRTKLKYAGARIDLIYFEDGQQYKIKADKQSVGYKRSSLDYEYKEHQLDIKGNQTFYLYTDGAIDQVGEENKFPFGNKRLLKLIEKTFEKPFYEQKQIILDTIEKYQGNQTRRDDITIVGFKAK
jgi:CheY-like chemotaxis protein